jgi:30S ribosomal protein S31
MGKGDQRSRRGKIHRGTFGRRRPKPRIHQRAAKALAANSAEAGPATAKEARVVKKQPKE